MRRIIYALSFVIVAFSCQGTSEEDESNLTIDEVTEVEENHINKIDSANTVTEVKDTFSISNFKIGEGRIGPVQVGMTVKEAEQELGDFTKEETTAYEFKYGGGGPAYIYQYKDEPVLGVLPAYNSDTIVVLVALHEDLITPNGLNPKSSVNEIKEKYPNITVNQDLMSGGEFMADSTHNWIFNFDTDDDNEIGEYPVIEVPSDPKRLDVKADWLIVK